MLSTINHTDTLGCALAIQFLVATKKINFHIQQIVLSGYNNEYIFDIKLEHGFLQNTSMQQLEEIMQSIVIEDIKMHLLDTSWWLSKNIDINSSLFIKSLSLIESCSLFFKILNVSGLDNNISRIQFLCYQNQSDLENKISHLAELKKRDHRNIAMKMDLFHFQEESPGIAFWHPQGLKIWRIIENYMRHSNDKYMCQEIKTPLIASTSLWERSGHSDKYATGMFSIQNIENKSFIVRPMNCPTCIQIFNKNLYSYKSLPVRLSEFGIVHRNEPSGALNGLFRSRSFTQDDGHIFCMPEQLTSEIVHIIRQCLEVYNDFGFSQDNINIKVSLRPEQRIGSDDLWDKAESVLQEALRLQNLSYEVVEGDGAFYGPKIELHLKDSLSRLWQCGTIQIDFFMPQRLDAFYIDSEGLKKHPILIHRAILGSLERFIAILLENYGGKLPCWLTPTQVMLIGVTNKQDAYIQEISTKLKQQGIRASFDIRHEKLGYKIREAMQKYIPYIAVAGPKEVENTNLSIRFDKKEIVCNITELVDLLREHPNFYQEIS